MSSATLSAPLKTGITIERARRGAVSALVWSVSTIGGVFLGSDCENRPAEREPQSRSQEDSFEGCRGTTNRVDWERVQGDPAGDPHTPGEKSLRDIAIKGNSREFQ